MSGSRKWARRPRRTAASHGGLPPAGLGTLFRRRGFGRQRLLTGAASSESVASSSTSSSGLGGRALGGLRLGGPPPGRRPGSRRALRVGGPGSSAALRGRRGGTSGGTEACPGSPGACGPLRWWLRRLLGGIGWRAGRAFSFRWAPLEFRRRNRLAGPPWVGPRLPRARRWPPRRPRPGTGPASGAAAGRGCPRPSAGPASSGGGPWVSAWSGQPAPPTLIQPPRGGWSIKAAGVRAQPAPSSDPAPAQPGRRPWVARGGAGGGPVRSGSAFCLACWDIRFSRLSVADRVGLRPGDRGRLVVASRLRGVLGLCLSRPRSSAGLLGGPARRTSRSPAPRRAGPADEPPLRLLGRLSGLRSNSGGAPSAASAGAVSGVAASLPPGASLAVLSGRRGLRRLGIGCI